MLREHLLAAYFKGWKVIPLKLNSKAPNLPKGHKFLTESPDKATYRNWSESGAFGNYGIVTGHMSGLTVVDVDWPEGFDKLHDLGIDLDTIETPQVLSPNGRHLYFKFSPKIRTGVGVMGKGVDIRNNGAYVVGPGSIVDGNMYVWSELWGIETELANVPDWVKEERDRTQGTEWKMMTKLGPGERNSKLTSLAGSLVMRELPQPLVTKVLLMLNRDWCEQPLDEEEVVKIAKSVERYRDEQKLLQDQK